MMGLVGLLGVFPNTDLQCPQSKNISEISIVSYIRNEVCNNKDDCYILTHKMLCESTWSDTFELIPKHNDCILGRY